MITKNMQEREHRLSRSPYDCEIHIFSHPSGAVDAESIIKALVHLFKTDIFIISYKKIFINPAVLDTLQPHSATTRPPIAVDWNFRQKKYKKNLNYENIKPSLYALFSKQTFNCLCVPFCVLQQASFCFWVR